MANQDSMPFSNDALHRAIKTNPQMRSGFLRRGFFFWAAGSYMRAASTRIPDSVIHSFVTSSTPSSSSPALDPCDRKAATHELNQDVGRDTLGRKDGLRAAVRVGNDELERTVAGGLRAAAWAQTVVRQLG